MNWNSFIDLLGRTKQDIDRRKDLGAAGMDSPWVAPHKAPGVMVIVQHPDGSSTLGALTDIDFDGDNVALIAREGLPFDWRNR